MFGAGEGLALVQDAATMACAGINAVYFAFYFRRTSPPARRLGAAILSLLNLGILVERTYLVELYLSERSDLDSMLEPLPWFLAHLLLFLGTLGTTALIIRQQLHR